MIGRVYPFGYASPGAYERLEKVMHDPEMILVDIRTRPFSQWHYQFNRHALSRAYDSRYLYLGESLGNVNYKSADREKGIQIANPGAGIPRLVNGLQQGYSLVLLCACKDYTSCHRRVVVDLLKIALPEIEVIFSEKP